MKTALHIINSLDPRQGGTSVAVPELASATKSYRNTVLSLDTYENAKSPKWQNIEVIALPLTSFQLYSQIVRPGKFRHLIGSSDIVHVHGLWLPHSVVSTVIACRDQIPVLISAHGMLQPWALKNKKWKKRLYAALLERPALRHASCLRALTRTEAQEYRNFGLKAPIAIIPNGTGVPDNVSSAEFLARYPELKDSKIILFLGRIHFKKGLDILCKAWASLQSTNRDAVLVLAGPEEENTRKHVHRLIAELGISERIVFTGMLGQKIKQSAMMAAHCFVLPSYSEGFSMAVLEALSCSLPVIISRACNFPEVDTYSCGWVVDTSEKELKEAINLSLHQSEASRTQQGKNAKALVQSKYTWDRVGAMLAETHDWLLGGTYPTQTEVAFT